MTYLLFFAGLVAEGIERPEDFNCIRDMGIACGQGYFIARPALHPARQLSGEVMAALSRQHVSLTPMLAGQSKAPTATRLAGLDMELTFSGDGRTGTADSLGGGGEVVKPASYLI